MPLVVSVMLPLGVTQLVFCVVAEVTVGFTVLFVTVAEVTVVQEPAPVMVTA